MMFIDIYHFVERTLIKLSNAKSLNVFEMGFDEGDER